MSRWTRFAAFTAAATACAALSAPRAEACSYLPGELLGVSPADGTTAAPLNAVVIPEWGFIGSARYRVEYQVVGSTQTMSLGTMPGDDWRSDGIPTVALPEAVAVRQVRLTFTPVEDFGYDPVVVELTHGAETDDDPPPAPAVPAIDLEQVDAVNHSCGPQEDSERIVATIPRNLDPDAAAYALFARESVAASGSPAEPPRLVAWALRESDRDTLKTGLYDDATDVCVFARTMDRAGHWSEPSPETCVRVASGCTNVRGSAPAFGAVLLVVGAAALGRRRVSAGPRGRGSPPSAG